MCTINMTFEVPEARHINIDALKKQMHSYLEFILSMPSIEVKADEKKYDMSFFNRFDNDLHLLLSWLGTLSVFSLMILIYSLL